MSQINCVQLIYVNTNKKKNEPATLTWIPGD
jgi:hypothetical protein